MSISITSSAHRISLASEFLMARRPVMDREQNIVAHELLFRETEADAMPSAAGEEPPAAASVIADVCQHGMERVIGDLFGILYLDADALMSDIFPLLPAQNVVLEIPEMPEVTQPLLDRMEALRQEGFRFALVVGNATRQSHELPHRLLPLVDGVRIDITGRERAELAGFCSTFRSHQKQLLAEGVETAGQFRTCFELGFDFFQGYYFTRMPAEEMLLPAPSSIAELTALIASDADSTVIEDRIREDITLGLNLLRMADASDIGVHRIESLHQVLMVAGRDRLQRWLQALADAGHSTHRGMMPALAQATLRGRLMELIAHKLIPGNRGIADTGFTVGVMSLMDAMFPMPMEEILRQIPVVDEIRDALLHREGYFGQLLKLVESAEWHAGNDMQLMQLVRSLKLSCNELYQLQLAAFEWSDQVRRNGYWNLP